ncbi:MAG TPA: DUF3857 and transglutaminase domain-containing protein [Edaphobacter sp.]|nr:DUF3857 and transglutaminase domain-containing protein [Edaphobacter sp.]
MRLHVRLVRQACQYCLAFAASLCVLTPPVCFAKQASVPDWVRTAAAQKLPAYPAETDAVILLDDTTYSVAPDGRATEHRRRVVKILRPQGRDDALVVVPFDSDTKINSLHIWSIGPDGHEYELKDNEIVEYGYPGQGNFFEDDKVKVARAPGRDPGGVVAYEYDQRVRPMLTEETWFFQSDLPSLNQTFTLELPPGFTFGAVWAHHNPVKVADLEDQRWRWEIDNVPAINLDHVLMRPSEGSLTGRMTVHYASASLPVHTDGTWQSIGEWYQTLTKDRLATTPEITAKANELTAGKTDFYDKAEAIAEFVQKHVRYFAIEMGIGGYQPHFAGDIFHNLYGDCKDKATLLSAMLSSEDIHSALMMVDIHRGVVDPDSPSIVGDHMIAAIEIPKGYASPRLRSVITAKSGRRYLIFDPTSEKTPFGQLEHELQGGYGLLMEGNQSEIVALPVLPPNLNTIHRTANLQLQPDGSLNGTIAEARFGDNSERRRDLYTKGDAKEQSDFIDNVLNQDFSSFTVSSFAVHNADSLNKNLTTSYTLHADHFGKITGPLLMVRPRVLGSEDLETDHEVRHVPVNLRQTIQATDDFNIQLPAGYTVDETPEPVKVDFDFASYESSTTVQGDVLHYTRTYTVREVTLPANRYADVQKLASAIAADEQSIAVLKKQ